MADLLSVPKDNTDWRLCHILLISGVTILPNSSVSHQSSSTWDEGIVGDFNAGQLFTLTEGGNWFIGSQAWAVDPVDGFRFTVPNGYRATIDITYRYLNLGDAEGTAWIWDLFSLAVEESCIPDASRPYSCFAPAGSALITRKILQTPGDFITPGDWDYVPIDGYMLNAATYQLADNLAFTNSQDSVLSYSFSLHVVPVPVPASIWLFASGMLGLIGMARRKKAA